MRNRVFDYWWPWRPGKIVKRKGKQVWVQWSDGEVWKYDPAHTKFLRTYK